MLLFVLIHPSVVMHIYVERLFLSVYSFSGVARNFVWGRAKSVKIKFVSHSFLNYLDQKILTALFEDRGGVVCVSLNRKKNVAQRSKIYKKPFCDLQFLRYDRFCTQNTQKTEKKKQKWPEINCVPKDAQCSETYAKLIFGFFFFQIWSRGLGGHRSPNIIFQLLRF